MRTSWWYYGKMSRRSDCFYRYWLEIFLLTKIWICFHVRYDLNHWSIYWLNESEWEWIELMMDSCWYYSYWMMNIYVNHSGNWIYLLVEILSFCIRYREIMRMNAFWWDELIYEFNCELALDFQWEYFDLPEVSMLSDPKVFGSKVKQIVPAKLQHLQYFLVFFQGIQRYSYNVI